ncbi:fumarylacetoacetate hydrolase family protein [Tunturiibacter lichenicola]|uniref:fumarylacetoacetate hydrolase family protein n=1 Tax=Tunturiibacter lichenicola TaxID=2051959 RepID=UPI003D9B1A81
MKLARFGPIGRERPGVVTDSNDRLDLSEYFQDWNAAFFASEGIERVNQVVSEQISYLPRVDSSMRIGAPIARPGKVICIGLNYSDHAEESGMPIPAEPIVFLKASNTVVGPYDDVLIPRGSQKTDWEVELGVVIARETRYLTSAEESLSHIAGFTVSHDVSEREFQLERGGQWTKGKSCDTFNPLGPFLVTPDEVGDPQSLGMRLSVNGLERQRGTTAKMIFNCSSLVHYLSQFMTLEPGDLISTGTPPGVGLGLKPPTYLKAGDVVELEIEKLGSQRQTFIATE